MAKCAMTGSVSGIVILAFVAGCGFSAVKELDTDSEMDTESGTDDTETQTAVETDDADIGGMDQECLLLEDAFGCDDETLVPVACDGENQSGCCCRALCVPSMCSVVDADEGEVPCLDVGMDAPVGVCNYATDETVVSPDVCTEEGFCVPPSQCEQMDTDGFCQDEPPVDPENLGGCFVDVDENSYCFTLCPMVDCDLLHRCMPLAADADGSVSGVCVPR